MIISTINLKGGVGKTTTAIALATAAVRDGKDVELYDCDPQSSASLWAMMAEEAGDLPVIEVYEGGVGPKDTPEADYAEAMLVNARTLWILKSF